jgi:hypothetical protein
MATSARSFGGFAGAYPTYGILRRSAGSDARLLSFRITVDTAVRGHVAHFIICECVSETGTQRAAQAMRGQMIARPNDE